MKISPAFQLVLKAVMRASLRKRHLLDLPRPTRVRMLRGRRPDPVPSQPEAATTQTA